MIEALKEALHIMEQLPTKKRCDTCIHFANEKCAASNFMTPPDNIKENGCESWIWDIQSPPF